jgi:predicted small secreted protein
MCVICFEEARRKTIALLFAVACALTLSACNTVQGMGKDIEKGGQAIEKVAK